MESEYVACSIAAREAIWLKRFFQSLTVTSLADEAIKMYLTLYIIAEAFKEVLPC